MMLLFAALVATCLAATPDTPILYVGDAGAAVMGVVERTQLNPWELDPVRLTDLVQATVFMVIGNGQPDQCSSRKLRMHEIGARVDLARARRARQQGEEALAEIEAGIAMLACLDEQAEASGVAELFYLGGLISIELGHTEAAATYLRRALTFSPQLSCGPDEPRAVCAGFDTIVRSLQEVPSGKVKIGPGVRAGTVFVDGRRAVVQGDAIITSEGRHLVQVVRVAQDATIVTSLDVAVVATGQQLVLVYTREIKDSVLAAPERPENTVVLSALAETNFPGRQVYLWSGEHAWSLSGSQITMLDDPPKDRSALKRGVFVAGGTAATVGVVLSSIGLASYRRNEDLSAEDLTDEVTDEEKYGEGYWKREGGWFQAKEGLVIAGVGLVAAGGAVIGGGLAPEKAVRVALAPTQGGVMAAVQVRR